MYKGHVAHEPKRKKRRAYIYTSFTRSGMCENGRDFLEETLAKFVRVPFVIADATTLT